MIPTLVSLSQNVTQHTHGRRTSSKQRAESCDIDAKALRDAHVPQGVVGALGILAQAGAL